MNRSGNLPLEAMREQREGGRCRRKIVTVVWRSIKEKML